MSYIDVTFERSATVVHTVARLADGWNGSKRTVQFYDNQFVDFRGDVRLRVAVWLRSVGNVKTFPLDFAAEYDNQLLRSLIVAGCLHLFTELSQQLPWRTSNGKPAVHWQYLPIAENAGIGYFLDYMIVFNLPSPKRGDYKAWDLLPFLPGGLVERNRRRH